MSRLRSDRLGLVAGLICLAGLGISGYLIYVHYAEIDAVCTTGGCERVQASEYSELAGVPVALLGLIGYGAIALSLGARGDLGRALAAALAIAGFGFSLYLTYLELWVIDAICQWCVASAVLMTALAAVTVVRLVRTPPAADGSPASG